jgi:hypothetical protein
MSTRPIFAPEYYTDPWLFLKGWRVDKTAEGTKFKSNFFTDFWGARNLEADVSNQGTMTTHSPSFFENQKFCFPFSENSHQIAAHRHLKELEIQLQNPLSPDTQTLKQEIHDAGSCGAGILQENLKFLDKEFQKSNQKSSFSQTLTKIVNFVRKLLHIQPLEFYDFTPLNLRALKEMAIDPALELTGSDRLRSRYFPLIQNHSPFPLPPELNRENLQKLELGLLDEIAFSIDQKHFALRFDPQEGKFIVAYWVNFTDDIYAALYDQREESYTYTSPVLDVVEKKLDGTEHSHPLQRSIHGSYYAGPWYHPWEKRQIQSSGGQMEMNMNSEYTFPLSQGNFSLKLYRRG